MGVRIHTSGEKEPPVCTEDRRGRKGSQPHKPEREEGGFGAALKREKRSGVQIHVPGEKEAVEEREERRGREREREKRVKSFWGAEREIEGRIGGSWRRGFILGEIFGKDNCNVKERCN